MAFSKARRLANLMSTGSDEVPASKRSLGTGSIATAALADDAITSAKIADDAIIAALIADNSVDIARLNVSDGSNGQALTTNGSGALAFASVGTADGSIITAKLADDAVTSAKLDNSIVMTGSLSAAQINGGITTTVISSSATATTGQNHFISSACTLTLPASPSLGDTVMVAVGNFATAILGRNSQKIEGTAEDMTIDVPRVGLTCVYTGSAYGWAIY
jgi:hypothetical protein